MNNEQFFVLGLIGEFCKIFYSGFENFDYLVGRVRFCFLGLINVYLMVEILEIVSFYNDEYGVLDGIVIVLLDLFEWIIRYRKLVDF